MKLVSTALFSLAAFSADGFSFSSSFAVGTSRIASKSSCLHSTPGGTDDDELSKLIGKRTNIVRRKRDDDEAELDVVLEDDFSLEELPDFETKRPVRTTKRSSDAEKDNPRSAAKEKSTIVDYSADYDDENEFHIPNRIGFTTRCWGDDTLGFVNSKKLTKQAIREGRFTPSDIKGAFRTLMEEGITFVDTSPEYGAQSSGRKQSAEHMLAACLKNSTDLAPAIVAATYPNKLWQRSAKGLTASISNSCNAIGISTVELAQVKTVGWLPSAGLIEGMNDAVAEVGNSNYAGVQNVSPLRMRRLAKKLDNYGLILATNSFEFSLTNQKAGKWINACKALGVIPLITNPTDGGLASAKYTATNPSGGVAGGRSKYSFAKLEKLQPLHSVLESVAQRVKTRVARDNSNLKDKNRGRFGPMPQINTDITPHQVAVNYVVAKGGVPLPEVNNAKDAKELAGCLGWSLSDEEIAMLESAADLCK